MTSRVLLILAAGLVAGCAGRATAPAGRGVEWVKSPDPVTGHEVWQITAADSASQAGYYETQGFTADERYLVFSSRRTGAWQLYRADLRTGEIVRLTDAAELGPNSFTMHPDGRHAYYLAGWTLGRVDVPAARAETVLDFRGILKTEPRRTPLSFSRDGAYTVVGSVEGEEALITRVSLADGKTQTVLRRRGGIGHPQISPADPNLITFVTLPDTQNDMTLPMEQRTRTWTVDARTGEVRRFVTAPYGFRAVHFVWADDGERFYFFEKTQPGWLPVRIVSVNRHGEDRRVHFTHPDVRLGHGDVSPDGRWFVSDGQTPGDNPLLLIDLETGASETLCRPDASIEGGHPRQAHVHPSFSPSGRYVVFTSDRSGVPQVYVVPVPESIYARLGG